jgi:uncharacterized coiled-coil protein SlyX
MSSTHTDLTYTQVEDMWRHPHELTPREYELVKYILNKELYEDDGNSIEELHQRLAAYEGDTQLQENRIAHMSEVIRTQGYKLDRLKQELLCVEKELAACKERNND